MCNGSAGTDALIADLCVYGIWKPKLRHCCMVDIRAVDIDVQAYHACTPHDVLCTS